MVKVICPCHSYEGMWVGLESMGSGKLFQGLQPLPLENEHIEHSNSDGRVSEIEDRTEENEMPVGTEEEIRQPGSILTGDIDDGEIEHVDHAPV